MRLKNRKPATPLAVRVSIVLLGGEGGIRTHGTLQYA